MQLFSKGEIKHLAIAIVVLTLIFSFKPFPNIGLNFDLIPYYAIIVIIAFLIHQVVHKLVARKFGCAAIFKIWPNGIFFGLVLMLIGIPFAAPGIVMIYPYFFGRWGYKVKTLTTNENGIIALSGPATNMFLAILVSIFTGFNPGFFGYFVLVNSWMAFSTIVPIPPLDGSKIMEWRIWVWGLMIAISILLIALSIGIIPL
jgi:Zn-dependent protease